MNTLSGNEWLFDMPADVFEQDEEMERVGGGRDEIEALVVLAGCFVFGVDG
jgi:hypothetical protein